MSFLKGLDLSMNSLSGNIPECLRNINPSLTILHLYSNKFDGTIPTDIFPKNCSLRSFSIGNNNVEGSIPESLINCKVLEVVDVGKNNLEGTFPSWLGKLKNLQVVILRFNRFYGHFNSSQNFTSCFSRLRIIDLSHNNFSGYLPTNFFENLLAMTGIEKKGEEANYMSYNFWYYEDSVSLTTKGNELQFTRLLTTLMFIDFSSNGFSGEIPEKIGELHLLVSLNFSHNSLVGLITSNLGKLSKLESLDLSSNKFQGKIPVQLTNLGFLSVLDLSNNNLTGPIPQGKQFDTYTNDSYLGNDGLCGRPLSKSCVQGQYSEPPAETIDEDELDWRFSILIGYGCGLVFGLSMGYIVFTKGKPWSLVRAIEKVQQKYVGRKKICKSGGRK